MGRAQRKPFKTLASLYGVRCTECAMRSGGARPFRVGLKIMAIWGCVKIESQMVPTRSLRLCVSLPSSPRDRLPNDKRDITLNSRCTIDVDWRQKTTVLNVLSSLVLLDTQQMGQMLMSQSRAYLSCVTGRKERDKDSDEVRKAKNLATWADFARARTERMASMRASGTFQQILHRQQ